MTILLIFGGFVLLALGGEFLVRGTVGLATRLGISPLLAGLTIVGFGTSAPELVTSLQAAFAGSPHIAVGNVVGSNIANTLLILGVSALIISIPISRRAFHRDGLAMGLSAIAVAAAIVLGEIGQLAGIVLFAGLIVYILVAYFSERSVHRAVTATTVGIEAEEEAKHRHQSLGILLLVTVGGMAAIIFGARFLVEGAVIVATAMGVSEAVIGLSLVALGTSLPELVACVVAAGKRQPDVALGNIVGSNIYNLLGILGFTAIITPLPVAPEIARVDIWLLLGTTGLLLLFLRTGWTIKRWEGGVLLAGYAAYLAYLAGAA